MSFAEIAEAGAPECVRRPPETTAGPAQWTPGGAPRFPIPDRGTAATRLQIPWLKPRIGGKAIGHIATAKQGRINVRMSSCFYDPVRDFRSESRSHSSLNSIILQCHHRSLRIQRAIRISQSHTIGKFQR